MAESDSRAPIVIHLNPAIIGGVPMVRMRQNTARIGLLAAFLAIASLVALPGCDNSRALRKPGTIQVDIEVSPTSTDPRFATDAISSRVTELIFDSLVKTDRNGH